MHAMSEWVWVELGFCSPVLLYEVDWSEVIRPQPGFRLLAPPQNSFGAEGLTNSRRVAIWRVNVHGEASQVNVQLCAFPLQQWGWLRRMGVRRARRAPEAALSRAL